MESEICYLLFMPYQANGTVGPATSISSPKDAPYFFDMGIEVRSTWGDRELTAAGTPVRVKLQVLDELVWVADCRYRLDELAGTEAILQKNRIHSAIQDQLHQEFPIEDELIEEFTILLKEQDGDDPDQLVDRNAVELVSFLRSLKQPISQKDANKTLQSRVRFSTDELTLVDWSGALLITGKGEFESDIDLLKVGKFQLFRYRLLDRQLQQMLQQIRTEINARRRKLFRRPANRTIREIVQKRLELLLDFEEIDQSLLMIGDWYSSELYTLIFERFSLNEWKQIIEGKLTSLESIHSAVEENLRFSWFRWIDFIVYWGWAILMVIYFVQLYIDLN